MAARLRALGDDRIGTRAHETLRERHRSHHRDNLGADFLEGRHILARVARARRHHRHLFIEHHLHNLFDIRQHDIHAKRLVRPAFAFLDFLAQELRRHITRTDDTETTGIGDRRSQLRRTYPGHTTLENRVFDMQELADGVILKHVKNPPSGGAHASDYNNAIK